MGETKANERKAVGRSGAVNLRIICILLIVGLGVAMAFLYDLNNTLNLGKSTVLVNDETVSPGAGTYFTWIVSVSYAGYVSVSVQSSTGTGCYVEVFYSTSYEAIYHQERFVDEGLSAAFPVLPSSNIMVGVGNVPTDATETVTITYHY